MCPPEVGIYLDVLLEVKHQWVISPTHKWGFCWGYNPLNPNLLLISWNIQIGGVLLRVNIGGVLRVCLGSCKDPQGISSVKSQEVRGCHVMRIKSIPPNPADLIQRGICKAPLGNPRVSTVWQFLTSDCMGI